jgi:acyl-CoA reductase-like NAD-dependent aldehyde dehydrogenase
MSTERIVVHSSIAAQFAEEYKAAVNEVFSADSPAPVVVTSAAVAKAKKLLTDAVEKGATVLTGDINAQEETDTRLRPVVLTGVKKDMDIYYQETFGPGVSVVVVESEEEAIAVANDTEYGLSSAVFTKDLARAFRVAREIKAG